MKAAVASFQFTGSRHDFHHSVRSASTLNSSCRDANGSMQSRSGGASSSRLIHAQPPHSSHRTGASSRSSASRLASSNISERRHEGVLAVESPAPPVERADEAAPRPAALDELHAAVAAGVVVGADGAVVDAHDDDRLVEDLVLDEVAGLGISSRRHAICQTRGQNSSVSSA